MTIKRTKTGQPQARPGIGDPLPSQLAALGWNATGPVAAVVGSAPDKPAAEALADAHAVTRRLGLDAMAWLCNGARLSCSAVRLIRDRGPESGAGLRRRSDRDRPREADIAQASEVTRAALSGLRAVPAWPGAPRPVSTDALLPERALAGDAQARDELIRTVYRPLVAAGDVLADTVSTFLDAGGSLDVTARALFVHANTVKNRLRRVADICGHAPTESRGAFTVRVALILGRLQDTLA